jgi:hypothetical protein
MPPLEDSRAGLSAEGGPGAYGEQGSSVPSGSAAEAAIEDTKSFFNLILPPEGQGWRCAAIKDGGSRWRHQFFRTNAELSKFLLEADLYGETAYHACASYREPLRRTGENVAAVASLWVDVDAGQGKPYADAERAAAAVAAFRDATSLTPLAAVRSGHGLHVYWRLPKPLAVRSWRPLAQGLKALAAKHGLEIDPVRTCDAASVLRPPGTTNRKNGENLPVWWRRGENAGPLETLQPLLDAAAAVVGGKRLKALPSWPFAALPRPDHIKGLADPLSEPRFRSGIASFPPADPRRVVAKWRAVYAHAPARRRGRGETA